jgi:hypothetical protein
MSHHNMPLEFIVAGAIWLTAIFMFVVMLIATFAALRSEDQTETAPKPSSFITRFATLFLKRKTSENKDNPGVS